MYHLTQSVRIIILLSLILATLTPLKLESQLKIYKGPLKVDEYLGHAKFQYEIATKDTILNGPFQMKGSNFDSIITRRINYYSIEGKYDENIPDSTWKFQFGNFSSDGESELDGYKIQLKIDGPLQESVFKIDKGRVLGKQHWVFNLTQSNISDTNFYYEYIIDPNSTFNKLLIKENNLKLNGNILNNGFANGKWEFESDDTTQILNLYFKNGVLVSFEKEENGNPISIQPITSDTDVRIPINFSEKFIHIINLIQELKNQQIIPNNLYKLIAKSDSLQTLSDSLLIKLGANINESYISASIQHFPLDDEEKSYLTHINQQLEKSDSILISLKNNLRLKVLRQSDDSVNIYLNLANLIDSNFIQKLRSKIEFKNEIILEFLPRTLISNVIFGVKKSSNSKDMLTNEIAKLLEIPNITENIQDENAIKSLSNFVEILYLSLESIQTKINQKIINYEKKQELKTLEEQLVEKQNTFKIFVDSAIKESILPYSNIVKKSSAFVENEIKKYWELNNTQIKTIQVIELIKCINNVESLIKLLIDIPSRNKTLEELYTVEVWNPFTVTTMTEITKQTIYDAYNLNILPHYYNEIGNNLSCDNVEKITNSMNKLHLKMFSFREEDTDEIEKKLKNTSNIKKILTIFNISTE